MSNYKKAPAEGDRIDIGGKLPQFDAFAWFVYKEMISNNLEWVRIGDPEALTLDDIQYSTRTELQAYQVKWSNQEIPKPISFKEFIELVPKIIDGWKSLKVNALNSNKKLKVSLLTNRPLSQNDIITNGDTKLGSFEDFYNGVWRLYKSGQHIEIQWRRKIVEIYKSLKISKSDFKEFCNCLEIITSFQLPKFNQDKLKSLQQKQDVLKLSRFIIDEVANKNKEVHFAYEKIIKALNWDYRFKTTFQHDLIVDKKKYQPISETINGLSDKIHTRNSGYIFLIGSPGSGKSTLLTQWSKNRLEKIIKYYAFDFTNPSSPFNNSERGEAIHLFFDLLIQLKSQKVFDEDILPFKTDLTYLQEIFYRLLDYLSNDYKKNNKKTIIIIDGLDHIPREYKSVTKTFLSYLPKPNGIPVGVIIVLGSQSYDLNDLSIEIKEEYRKSVNTITISPFSKKTVNNYISSSEIRTTLSNKQKDIIFEKSQGHPLYLSYLIEEIKSTDDIDSVIADFSTIDGYIDNYYKKIWESLRQNSDLIEFLGLLARIKSNINPLFVNEWGFENIYSEFNSKASHLFDKSETRWSFFHNSFRQFLIFQTSVNLLTEKFEKKKDIEYHKKLDEKYKNSQAEPVWKRVFHLFKIADYEESIESDSNNAFVEFVNCATPDSFFDQLINYRPPEEIKQDIRLGVQICGRKKDIYLLIRYICASAELESRLFHLDPTSFFELYLRLSKSQIAKDYLRYENTLYCSKKFAMKAARIFYELGDRVEAKLLFTLAEPENVSDSGINITDDDYRYDELKDILEEWVQTSAIFYPVEEIILRLNNISYSGGRDKLGLNDTVDGLRVELLYNLCLYLIKVSRWKDVELVLAEMNLTEKSDRDFYFNILYEIIEECYENNNIDDAKFYLKKLLGLVTINECPNKRRIYVADLIYKVLSDNELVVEWLKGVSQPDTPDLYASYNENTYNKFIPRIKLNKLLNILGEGVSITEAVPEATDEKNIIVVEFERMLCLITKILSDTVIGKAFYGNISSIVDPIVKFYYRDRHISDSNWYKLTLVRDSYYEFLIYSVSQINKSYFDDLAEYFFEEFITSGEFWHVDLKRKIILNLFENGYNIENSTLQLQNLESTMLQGQDISGRIEECSNQAKAWLKIGRNEKAEHWLKQAMKESIGIGYRKDYQFDSWLEWLQLVNKIDPAKATERILWFLSHLQHIKDTTESAYYGASHKLLETSLAWQYRNGIKQFEWQLDKGLISFESALSIVIEETLSNSKDIQIYKIIFDLFVEVLLPIAEAIHDKIIKQLCEVGYNIIGNEYLDFEINKLVNAIRVQSLEENRKTYLSTISTFLSSNGIPSEKYNLTFEKKTRNDNTERDTYESKLILSGENKTLLEEEVLNKINSFADFYDLFTREDKVNSYFNWSKVLDKIGQTFNISQIKELAKLNFNRRETPIFAKFSRIASDLQENQIAKDLAFRALELSNPSGWVKHYDGGSRIIALDALKYISPEEGYETASNVFINDVINADYPGYFVEHLHKILPIISESIDLLKVWDEIEEYLKRLMSNSSPIIDLPNFYNDDSSICHGIIDLLFYLAQIPANIIHTKSQKVIAQHLNIDNEKLVEELKKFYKDGEEHQELFINVLLLLDIYSPENVNLFLSELKNLSYSENYFIRSNSLFLVNKFDKLFRTSFSKKILSPIYSMYISPSKAFQTEKEVQSTGFVEDTDDPHVLLKVLDLQLDILHMATRIERINLEYKVVSLIKEWGEYFKVISSYEKNIRANHQEIDLKYTYNRPRALVARRAFMHVLTELIDSGILRDFSVMKYFDFYDHSLDFIPEIEKPDFIQILDEQNSHSLREEWVNSIDSSSRIQGQLMLYKPEIYVIAEYSKVRTLFWGKPTEIYMAHLTFDKTTNRNKKYYIFNTDATNEKTSSYLQIHNQAEKDNFFIVQLVNNYFSQSDIKSHWLAFNPEIAYKLEWIPDDTRLFAWKNKNNELMVESIYWRNGNVDMGPPHLYSEAGEGWFIAASKKAIKQICNSNKNIFLEQRLTRKYYNEGRKFKNSIDIKKSFSLTT